MTLTKEQLAALREWVEALKANNDRVQAEIEHEQEAADDVK